MTIPPEERDARLLKQAEAHATEFALSTPGSSHGTSWRLSHVLSGFLFHRRLFAFYRGCGSAKRAEQHGSRALNIARQLPALLRKEERIRQRQLKQRENEQRDRETCVVYGCNEKRQRNAVLCSAHYSDAVRFDGMNCPRCGSHDYGLHGAPCVHCECDDAARDVRLGLMVPKQCGPWTPGHQAMGKVSRRHGVKIEHSRIKQLEARVDELTQRMSEMASKLDVVSQLANLGTAAARGGR